MHIFGYNDYALPSIEFVSKRICFSKRKLKLLFASVYFFVLFIYIFWKMWKEKFTVVGFREGRSSYS